MVKKDIKIVKRITTTNAHSMIGIMNANKYILSVTFQKHKPPKA